MLERASGPPLRARALLEAGRPAQWRMRFDVLLATPHGDVEAPFDLQELISYAGHSAHRSELLSFMRAVPSGEQLTSWLRHHKPASVPTMHMVFDRSGRYLKIK